MKIEKMRSMYRSGTRLEFESISWMLLAHCRIANQGRSSLSTASILTPLDPSRRSHDMKSDKWSKNCLARLGTINCNCDMHWFMPCTTCNVQAPRTMLKESLENRITGSQMWKRKTISSIVRNFPNRSRENAKIRILKVTIITPNCQLFWGDIHPSWVTYTSQEPSGNRHESPCAYSNYKVSKPSTHICFIVRPKRIHSTLQQRLSASSFNSLIDLSLE